MKILVDSREQLPLIFDNVETEVRRLDVGDYMCEIDGKVIPVSFDRKGLGDLYGTMFRDYDRFKAEMMRAKESGTKLIVIIEGSLSTVLEGYSHSTVSGDSMLRKLATLHTKYDLEYHFCNTREEMARFIFETFDSIYRHWKKVAA